MEEYEDINKLVQSPNIHTGVLFNTLSHNIQPIEITLLPAEEEIIRNSIIFHSTLSIDEIVRSGHLVTQSVLSKEYPDHYNLLTQSSRAASIENMPKKWAPMLTEDANILHFSLNKIEGVFNKGATFLVMRAADLLINNPLYFRFGESSGFKHPKFVTQLCVSDVINPYGFERGDELSRLKIPLNSFTLFTPEANYKNLKELLLQSGFSDEYIKDQLLSYSTVNDLSSIEQAAKEVARSHSLESERKSILFERYTASSEMYNPLLRVVRNQ